MAGSVYEQVTGVAIATLHPGDQTGYDAAKAIVAASGGVLDVGPGGEALVLGALNGITCLLLRTNTGVYGLSRLHILDGTDPTKRMRFDASAIGAGLTRVATLPDWDGMALLPATLGVAGQFLRSGGPGVQPAWAAVVLTNALLDGASHVDTLAGTVLAGDIIIGNATPKWARLGKGLDGQVLTLVSGLPAWSASGATLLDHSVLAHLKPIAVPNCSWANGSPVITTSASGFANVKPGDFIVPGGNSTAGNGGRRVSTWDNANQVTVDLANTGSSLVNVTLVIVPGDHWDDSIAQDSNGQGVGLVLASGRGTFSQTGPGATFQELRGPFRWMSHGNGTISTDFRVQGSSSTGSPFGFCIEKTGTSNRVYIHVNDLATGAVVLRLGNPSSGDFFIFSSLAADLLSKTLKTGNKLVMDGTATYCVFQSAALVDRLSFDMTPMSALRSVKWPDRAGTVRVQTLAAPVYGATITTDVNAGSVFKIVVTNGTAFTISNPTLSGSDTLAGKEITYDIVNSSGGAMGAITWDTQFLLAGAFTNPASTKRRTIRFYWDGTSWVEICRAAADI